MMISPAASLLAIAVILLISINLSSAIMETQQQQAGNGHYMVPAFDTTDLQSGRGYDRLSQALATTGLIALSMNNIIDYSDTRNAALGGLCECAADSSFAGLEGADSVLLGDGQTVRSTLATATVGNSPLPLTLQLGGTCGVKTAEAMDGLRDHLALASSTFLGALDKLLAHERRHDLGVSDSTLLRNSYGGSYHTVSSIVQAASNLEHFHVYSKQKKATSAFQNQPALQMHTDAGLFLAFVPAHDCSSTGGADESFYLEDSSGETLQAVFPSNSIAIMLGAGAEHWLKTPESLSLKATRHSVDMGAGDSRAWYGMMHLVPETAIVDQTPTRQVTFGEMREAMVLKSTTKTSREYQDDMDNVDLEDISIGCGFSKSSTSKTIHKDGSLLSVTPRRRLQHVENAGACNNVTNFYCWMSCLDIPQADQAEGFINEDYSLYCVDPSVLAKSGKVSDAIEPCDEAGVTGLAMNSNCMGMWQPTAPGIPSQQVIVNSSASDFEEPWCYGGTSMYMDGFQWVGSTCPIYLFPSLVISSAGALVAACVFTIFFGIALEWVIQRRRVTVQSYTPGYQRLLVSASFYGVQLTMGYSIMLVIMIYSIPLFLSTVIGIVGGHILFSSPDAIITNSGGPCDVPSEVSPEGACCDTIKVDGDTGHSSTTNGCTWTECSNEHRKIENIVVAEGSTPCCQHVL